MAWQLENWLRVMIYVELRAAKCEWEEAVKKCVNTWPPYPQSKDKELNHMTTRHEVALSYLGFGELWNLISNKDNWPLFDSYFPPEKNTQARSEEIKTIRKRVAHFREPHPHDEARFKLFLQDVEPGVRRFCTRYSRGVGLRNDPVQGLLTQSWENIGYGYELWCPDRSWLYAPGHHRGNPLMHATLDICIHNTYKKGSSEGTVYRLKIRPGLSNRIDIASLLNGTQTIHDDVIHLIFPEENEFAVSVPAILGAEKVASILGDFLGVALDCSRSSYAPSLLGVRDEWPEYVLWPDNFLSFFDHESRYPVFEFPENS